MYTYLEDSPSIWEIAADHVASNIGNTSVAFELIKPPAYSLTPRDVQRWHYAWVKALSILPENTIVHLQDWYRTSTHKEDPAGYAMPEHVCYCFISRIPARPYITTRTRPEKMILSKGVFRTTQSMADFIESISVFKRIITMTGLVNFLSLTTTDLAGSNNSPGLIRQYCQLVHPEQNTSFCGPSFEKTIRIGEKHCTLQTVSLPEYFMLNQNPGMVYRSYFTEVTPFHTGFAAPLGIKLPFDHIYNQYIRIGDANLAIEKLTEKQIWDYKPKINNDHSVHFHCNVFSWTANGEQLPSIRSQVNEAITRLGAAPNSDIKGAPQLWCAGIPGNAADLPLFETVSLDLKTAAAFLIPDSNR